MVYGKFDQETDPKQKEAAIKKEIEHAQSIPMYFVWTLLINSSYIFKSNTEGWKVSYVGME